MGYLWGGTVRCRNESTDDSQPRLRVSDNFCNRKVTSTSTPGVLQTLSVGGLYSGDSPLFEHYYLLDCV